MGARPALLQGELSDGAVLDDAYTEELTQAFLNALMDETRVRVQSSGTEAPRQDEQTAALSTA